MTDDRKSRKLLDKGIWAALAVVSVTSVFSNLYNTREVRRCSQQQIDVVRELHEGRAKREIARDEIHDILGHTGAIWKMVQSQGENLQNPDYYESSLKTQCERALKLGYSKLAEMNPHEQRAEALKRKLAILEDLVANWIERQRSRKTRVQLLSEFAGNVENAVEGLIPYVALAEMLRRPTPRKLIHA